VFLLGKLDLDVMLNLETGVEAETGSADFLVNSLSESLMSLFFSSFNSYFFSTVFFELPLTVLYIF